MLMMSRRTGETILIGDDIEIVIAHIGRSRVKVGIRAPRETQVVAREVKLVREENLAAAARKMETQLPDLIALLKANPQVFPVPAEKGSVRQDAGIKLGRISPCLSPSKPT
jgi:carbon storage regulator